MSKSWKDIKVDKSDAPIPSTLTVYGSNLRNVLSKVYYKTLMNLILFVPSSLLVTLSSCFFYYFNHWTRPFAYFN